VTNKTSATVTAVANRFVVNLRTECTMSRTSACRVLFR
jgi:hypothetical protein